MRGVAQEGARAIKNGIRLVGANPCVVSFRAAYRIGVVVAAPTVNASVSEDVLILRLTPSSSVYGLTVVIGQTARMHG